MGPANGDTLQNGIKQVLWDPVADVKEFEPDDMVNMISEFIPAIKDIREGKV